MQGQLPPQIGIPIERVLQHYARTHLQLLEIVDQNALLARQCAELQRKTDDLQKELDAGKPQDPKPDAAG